MRDRVTVLAPAKLNLALDVVGILPGGYHALDMTMQAISLYERVVIRRSPYLDLTLPGSNVKPGPGNTAIKAALAFFHYTGLLAGADITIYKNVPVRAGMAGGSADAAAHLIVGRKSLRRRDAIVGHHHCEPALGHGRQRLDEVTEALHPAGAAHEGKRHVCADTGTQSAKLAHG